MFRTACLALTASVMAAAPAMASEPVSAEVYVSGLTTPLDFVQNTARNNIQYVVQQNGLIRVIQNGNLLTTPLLNVQSRISTGGERGLLGMALDPDFENNGRFYINYTANGADFGDTHVARYTLQSTGPGTFNQQVADFASEEVLLNINQDFSNHNGGCLRTGPDGYLYIAMGDGGSGGDPNNRAQTRTQLLGKFLRIDISTATGYDIPADNPYVGHSTFREEIWSYGVRNTWRFTFDDFGPCASNGLIMGDVGQNAREEINFEPAVAARQTEAAADGRPPLQWIWVPRLRSREQTRLAIERAITGEISHLLASSGAQAPPAPGVLRRRPPAASGRPKVLSRGAARRPTARTRTWARQARDLQA